MRTIALDVARRLIAGGVAPSRIDADQLAASGGYTHQEFRAAFPDLPTFQRDLALQLFAEARDAVILATTGKAPGVEQLGTAFLAYLDYNLQHPALQELAHHLQYQREGLELLKKMEDGVALVVQADLEAMNADLRSARAKLLTALAVAVVRAEYQAKRPLADMRQALFDYCRRSAGG